jgi:hypothetical protein
MDWRFHDQNTNGKCEMPDRRGEDATNINALRPLMVYDHQGLIWHYELFTQGKLSPKQAATHGKSRFKLRVFTADCGSFKVGHSSRDL